MSIIQIYQKFPTTKDCFSYLEDIRWKGKPSCVYCQSTDCTSSNNSYRYYCLNCRASFSVTVGTIFHHTHLPLQKWFFAITLLSNSRKWITSHQLAIDIKVNQTTANRILIRVKKALQDTNQRTLLNLIAQQFETHMSNEAHE